jgi:hypothetical protein
MPYRNIHAPFQAKMAGKAHGYCGKAVFDMLNLDAIDDFALQPLQAGRTAAQSHQRRLHCDGRDTGVCVCGDRIVAQYRLGSDRLLITDYDYFDGVTHWLYLLDKTFKVIDLLSPPDTFGFMQDLQANGARLQFGFYELKGRWELNISGRPFWSFSRQHLAVRRNRFLLRRRRLCLTGPDTA